MLGERWGLMSAEASTDERRLFGIVRLRGSDSSGSEPYRSFGSRRSLGNVDTLICVMLPSWMISSELRQHSGPETPFRPTPIGCPLTNVPFIEPTSRIFQQRALETQRMTACAPDTSGSLSRRRRPGRLACCALCFLPMVICGRGKGTKQERNKRKEGISERAKGVH